MVLDMTVKDEFCSWLGREVNETEQVGILVELSFIDGYLKRKRKGHVFSGEAENTLRILEGLSGSSTFHKYVAETVASQHRNIDDDYVTYEISRLKAERLEMACDFYSRFLRRRLHEKIAPAISRVEKHVTLPVKKVITRRRFPGQSLYRELKEFLHLPSEKAKEVKALLKQEGFLPASLWENREMDNLFKLAIFDEIDRRQTVFRKEFEKEIQLPEGTLWQEEMERTVKELEKEGLIEIRGGFLFRSIPKEEGLTIAGYSNSLKDPREQIILRLRLQGKSLRDIGDRLYITRERVRQLAARLIAERPPVAEDRWKESWETYGMLGSEIFRYLFNVNMTTVNYLNMAYDLHKGNHPRKELLSAVAGDGNLSQAVRERAEGLLTP